MTYFAELTARLGKALGMKGAPAAQATAPTRTVEPSAEPPVASPQASASPAAGAE
jgi:hypothetical protein